MKYVAFIRGVGPENPNMHGAKLQWFFESLGFINVRAVISSGNVIFETQKQTPKILEAKIEAALPQKLGFKRATIVRSQTELKKLFASDPFHGTLDTPTSRLNVTFLKKGGADFSVINPHATGTPAVMRNLEKKHGKEITTRTWKTLALILKKMEA